MEWGFYAGGRRVGESNMSLGLVRTETGGAMSTLPRDLISEKEGRTAGRRGAKTGAWVKRGGEEARRWRRRKRKRKREAEGGL